MQALPLLSIKQSIEIYQDLHAQNPSFGMDVFSEEFEPDDFVILQNNGKGSKGVPIRCEHYILILTLNGSSTRNINQHTYKVKAHSIQLIEPGAISNFEDTQENSEFFVLLFNESFLFEYTKELMQFHQDTPTFVTLEGLLFNQVLDIFEQLNLEYKNRQVDYKEISQSLLIQLLYLLKREKALLSNIKFQNRSQQISSQFLCLIESNFQKTKSVQYYADTLELTAKHLSETIKETLHESALFFIHARLIKEIQFLLVIAI